jgi:peptidoglycan/LPS O-acetylase OafA/YrhL
MKTQIKPSHKVLPIEGLRGYLALAVILQHLIYAAGYDNSHPFLKVIGSLAVKVFIIISGFVIFFLIDTRKEPYQTYIARRFFRLFPILAVLFAASVFCLILAGNSLQQCVAAGLLTPDGYADQIRVFRSCWQNLPFHVLAHLTMLHGLIPDKVLPYSSVAFLGPAWSLSLEWQFYLIAPLWYSLFTTASVWKKGAMYVFCLACILGSKHFFPSYNINDAAILFYVEFFLFGIISYFLYRSLNDRDRQSSIFPSVVLICLVVYKSSGRGMDLFPFLFWASFFALLIEPPACFFARCINPVFTNSVSLWLGKVSYSIYLSHALVLTLVQWALLTLFPHATQARHFLMLAPLTVLITIGTSAILYYSIEAPFMKFGSKMAKGKAADASAEKLTQVKTDRSS